MGISELLTDPEVRRFSKQMTIPEIGLENQEKLKQAKVAVIGIGGIGSSVIQYLAAAGVGNIGIIDYTLVEESNIQRQTLYGGSDLGKLKSIVSKQHLQDLFPFVSYEIINLQLTQSNIFRIIESFDLVIDATNDPLSNLTICDACDASNVPLVFGSVINFEGSVALITKIHFERYREHLNQRLDMISGQSVKGASALAHGLIGNLIALEVFKKLINHPKTLSGEMLKIDILSCQTSKVSF